MILEILETEAERTRQFWEFVRLMMRKHDASVVSELPHPLRKQIADEFPDIKTPEQLQALQDKLERIEREIWYSIEIPGLVN